MMGTTGNANNGITNGIGAKKIEALTSITGLVMLIPHIIWKVIGISITESKMVQKISGMVDISTWKIHGD